MASTELEKRVAVLEEELARLKSQLAAEGPATPWWQRIAGHSPTIPSTSGP